MSYLVPGYLLPLELGAVVAILIAVLLGLRRALGLAGWSSRERGRAIVGVVGVLVIWFFAAAYLSWAGFFRGSVSGIPAIPFGVLIPIVLGAGIFWVWPALRRVVDAVPQEWIVGLQFYRALGFIFLVLYAAGRLPGAFAWPAGVGDVLVGLLAPVVGIAYARRGRGAAGLVRAWNLLGIADLIVALGTGFLTSPSRFQLLSLDAPNQLVSAFPLALVPVYLVPLSLLLHFASLTKLRQAGGALGIASAALVSLRS